MEARPPAREHQRWMWWRPEPTMPPGLNPEEAWAWAMDNFPALCRRSCPSGPEAMEAHPPAWDDLPWMCGRPEPTMPPGLNPEEAWARAMDNFPALCRPSYASALAMGEPSRGAHGLLSRAGAWPVDVPGAERGRKPRRDPRVYDPKAESAKDPLPPLGDAGARSGGHTDAAGAMMSPSPPRKRLKTQA